jgi:uncharacterized protein (DUF58 family)
MTASPQRQPPRRVTSQQIAAAGWPPLSRAKDINAHPYFRGAISRWAWRFYTHRLTPASRWFFTLSVLFISLGYSSLDLQIYVPFTYAFGIWTVAIAGANLFKPRVALVIRHAHRIRAGEILPIDVDIQQRRSLLGATMTLIPHCLPPALDAVPEDGTPIPSLARGQKTHLRTGIYCARRGLHRWKGFRMECDFPFGLIRAYRTYPQPRDVLVFPPFTRLARLQIPVSLRYQPGGVVFASTLAESLEYIGNREYREGDNIRDIDWRATARLNLPIVREYREEYFLRVGVILDTHLPDRITDGQRSRSLKIKEQQAQSENFERAVSLAAAVSDYMARSDYIVDLFAAGPNLFHLTAGRSLAYLDQILDILACVEGSVSEPFDVLEPEILASLAQITTIVCVFMDWNAARQAFVGRLQREGAGIKVIVVRDSPCTLDPNDVDMPGGITVISKADFLLGIEEI